MKSKVEGNVIYIALFTITLTGLLGSFALNMFSGTLDITAIKYRSVVTENAAISSSEFALASLYSLDNSTPNCSTIPSYVSFENTNSSLRVCSSIITCTENFANNEKMFSLRTESTCNFNGEEVKTTYEVNSKITSQP